MPDLPPPGVFLGALVVVPGYAMTLGLSGVLVRTFCRRPPPATPAAETAPPRPHFDPSAVIGKCENILALTFILAGEATGLALIFAAKSLVRSEKIREDAGYYLGGTLVNLTWSVLMGYAIRGLLCLLAARA